VKKVRAGNAANLQKEKKTDESAGTDLVMGTSNREIVWHERTSERRADRIRRHQKRHPHRKGKTSRRKKKRAKGNKKRKTARVDPKNKRKAGQGKKNMKNLPHEKKT